jgi:hypothetical protein
MVVAAEEPAEPEPGSTRQLVENYRTVLAHDYGEQVRLTYVDWKDLRSEHEEQFLEAHKHQQRGEGLPYTFVDGKLYWTDGLSLRELMKEIEARGCTANR